ncbi:4a-hydroxytetrahydrobiopterin dehydratase [Salsuginibacillus kocurii]|uniref:4a-hydroxytetrahydrobiopterin dehydratase n=1 Tax=Salsuginibacillus kocurii TaxID=427078 RepID=UPI00037E6F15|nr:4a-hydroxytetrahydrobiopterin dehydratase [Salsuginibacillus kocurii]
MSLSSQQINEHVEKLEGWERTEEEMLAATFTFSAFLEGIQFVQRLAEYAEEVQHHPQIVIDHTAITTKLKTFDQGKITQKDIDAAYAIQDIYQNL